MNESRSPLKRAHDWARHQLRSPRSAAGLAVFLSLLAGSSLGLMVVPRAPSPSDAPPPPPPLEFLGSRLPQGEEAFNEALKRSRAFTSRPFVLDFPDGKKKAMSLLKWGAFVGKDRLKTLLQDASDSSSSLRHYWEEQARINAVAGREQEVAPRVLPSSIELKRELALTELLRLKDAFDREARDARLNLKTGEVSAHRSGQWLDVDATLLAMDQALSRGELRSEAILMERPAGRRSEELRGLSFESVLGHFETRYSRTDKAADRSYNLGLAANRLDGSVLLPGEEFDFNRIVGARDEAAGYKVATVIANGELVDGIGGGTCQISGTLHGAAFFAGLEIVERYPHTRPSSYIKMGMDATVVYPTINFRFRNPYEFPIAVHQTVENGIVRAEILGPQQDQVVTLIRRVDQAIPYEQIEREDSRLPRGTSLLAQRGIPGFRLHRYRTIRRGSHTVREQWRDIYPPTNQVIRIGSGGPLLEKRPSVGTPEYQADELLIITQRRPVAGNPGEFVEKRESGKYGRRGWTKEAGMPFWESP